MSPRLGWCSTGVGILILVLGCGADEDTPEETGGSSGTTNAGGSSGSAARGGSAGTGGSGKAGSGGTSAEAGRGGSAAGKGGSSSAGTGAGASGGADDGGASGQGGSGTGGSGGGAVEPGECGATPTFEDGVNPSREVFVDANAAGPGDGSAEDPYTTLDAALGAATPGTAVRIRPGTYAGGAFASDLNGTEAAPIWIGGVPGEERPVISGGNNAIQLSGASYVILHDLEVTGQTANGLNVDDRDTASGLTHHLVFRNLLIYDLGDGGNQDCLKLSGVDQYFVLDSEFRGCSGGSAVDHVGCHDGVVSRNTFIDLGGNGVQSKGGSSNIEIRQNRFLNAGERAVNMGGSTGFEFFRPALSASGVNVEARDIRVVANLFRGGLSPIAFVGCVDCLAAHNTIVDPDRWVVRILQETTSTEDYEFAPASGGRFVNNIVYYALGQLSTHVNVGGETAPETFEFSDNLWYAYDAPGDSQPSSLPVAEVDGVYGEDPAFADSGADDYAIGADSPAAGAGTAVSGVPGDIEGACYAEPPSIGAHEAG